MCINFKNKNHYFYTKKDYKNDIIVDFLQFVFETADSDFVEFYVHNLNFDGLFFIETASKYKFKLNIFSNKTNLYWLIIEYANIKIKLRCSYKILPLSLKKIGNIEKEDKKFFPYKFANFDNLFYKGTIPSKEYWENDDYENFLKSKSKDFEFDFKKEAIEYCFQDVLITKLALTSLIKIINLEDKNALKKNYSTPSISYYIFFKKYNYNNINNQIKKKDDEFVRNSYFGGRCEVFGNVYDNEYIKYFDFSGMYAQCMKEKFHFGDYSYEIPLDFYKPGFYTIIYKSEDMMYPILPHHSKNNKLLFSNGINSGTFWFEEIIYFLKNGGKIIKILHALVFEKFDYVFDQFVDKFTILREKGGYYNIFGKLMINSFYGSTGLKNQENVTLISYSENEVESVIKNLTVINYTKINEIHILVIEIDNKFKKIYGIEEFKNSKRNVSLASAITSKARIKLHKLMMDVVEDGGRLLYCDTDSVFAGYDLKNNLKFIKDKKWIDFYKEAVFGSSKTYALLKEDGSYELKIKGISQKNISYDDFKKNFYNSNSLIFENQNIFFRKNFSIEFKNIDKNLNLFYYDKRLFDSKKKETYPLTILNDTPL